MAGVTYLGQESSWHEFRMPFVASDTQSPIKFIHLRHGESVLLVPILELQMSRIVRSYILVSVVANISKVRAR